MSNFVMVLVGDLLTIFGAAFLFLGSLGLVRMPDVFNRIQAGTKASTLGILALLLGLFLQHPDWWPKLALILMFVLVTTPVSSSTIARAALLSGIRPYREQHRSDVAGLNDESRDRDNRQLGDAS